MVRGSSLRQCPPPRTPSSSPILTPANRDRLFAHGFDAVANNLVAVSWQLAEPIILI